METLCTSASPALGSITRRAVRAGRVFDQSKISVKSVSSVTAPLYGDVHCLLTKGIILFKTISSDDGLGRFGPLSEDATIALLNQSLALDFICDTNVGGQGTDRRGRSLPAIKCTIFCGTSWATETTHYRSALGIASY
ncbi:unnamed protein product [Sympodiomycopsis kandeliae]